MRKGFLLSVVVVVAVAGCHQCGPKASTGWQFTVLRPPTISTESTVLLAPNSGLGGAYRVGAAADLTPEGPALDCAPISHRYTPALQRPLFVPPVPALAPCEEPRMTPDQYSRLMHLMRSLDPERLPKPMTTKEK